MLFLEAIIEIFLSVILNILLFIGMLCSFGLSLDPYAPHEENLAFLLLSTIPLCYWLWKYLTRNEPVKFWRIF